MVNWWGCNDGPGSGSCDQISGDGVAGDNWILFELEADPVSILNGATSNLTASLLNTFNGDNSSTLAGAECTVPDGQEVEFSGGAFGNVDPIITTLSAGLAGSTFTAASPGVANDITATVNAGQTATTTVTIQTKIGQLSVEPTSFDFGGVLVGADATASFTLRNTGDVSSSLDLTSIAVGAGDFSVTGGDCEAGMTTLDGGQDCTVIVEFAPTEAGAANGSLDVASDAGDVTATLDGEGLAAAALAIDPTSFYFSGVLVGADATASFTLSNTGDVSSSLALTSIAVGTGDFSVTGGDCEAGMTTLNGGQECTVIVEFAPTEAGALSASLMVESDAGDVTVSLSGIGLANEADLMITAEPLDPFGELGAQFGYIVVVVNSGPADVASAEVTSILHPGLVDVTWTCTADPGAACPASGTDDLDEMVDLPAGSMVMFTILSTLIEGDEQEEVVSTFTVSGPVSPPDPDLSNNMTEVRTRSGIFADGFESPPNMP